MKLSIIALVLGFVVQFTSADLQLTHSSLSTLISISGGFAIAGGLLGIIAHIIPLDGYQ